MNTPPWLAAAIEQARAEGRILSDSGMQPASVLPASEPVFTKAKQRASCQNLATDSLRLEWPESTFTKAVITEAHFYGYRAAHFRAAPTGRRDKAGKPIWQTAVQGDGAGFPDLCITKTGILIFAELKARSPKKKGGWNKPSSEQLAWLAVLASVPSVLAVCWTPADWPEIVRTLKEAKP